MCTDERRWVKMSSSGGSSGGYSGKLAEECKSMKQVGDFSPVGLKVLVVDDDRLCLKVLEGMLRQCNYQVTTCCKVSHAITMVKEKKNHFDLVICEVYMPDEDGFQLLEIVGLGLDLPVIMMSTNGDTTVVMKGITHGACDFLIKPIRIEALKNIWQHVLRRKGRDYLKEEVGECDDREGDDSPESSSKKRKDSGEYGDEVIDDISSLKRARVHWTVQLHQQFVTAVNQLGVDKAVPKRIVEIMKVQGLSRENVASHLQKYRLYLKRLSGSIPESYPVASFQAADDSVSGGTMKVHQRGKGSAQSSVVKGLNLGAGVSSSSGIKELDQGTLKSLEQFRTYQQKIAANRAQVLGGLGVLSRSSNSSNMGGSSKGNKNGLHRMSSLDVGMLWKVQCEQDEEKKLKAAKMNLPPKAVSSSKENVITFDQGFEQKASFDHSFEQKVAFDNKSFEQKDPSFDSKSFDQKATKFDPKFEQKDAFEKKIVEQKDLFDYSSEQKMVNQWQPGEPIRTDACSISFQGSSSAAQFEVEHHASKPILKNVDERRPMEDTPWSGSSFRPGFLKSVGGPRNPLNRMSSIDMGLLWKAQQEQSEDYEKPGRIQLERRGSRRTIINSFAPLPAWQNQSTVSVEKTDSSTTIKSIIPDVNELHSLDDISWLDDTYKSQSPKILAPSTNIFDSFLQVAGGSPEPNIPESDSSKQSFPPADYGLSDISEYLMDDFNSNK